MRTPGGALRSEPHKPGPVRAGPQNNKAMKANIKLSLFKLSVVKLLALLQHVIKQMTGNANFTTPAVPLATMQTLADDFEIAIEAAINGSRQSRLVRDQIRDQVRAVLTTQADYVRTMCGGDVAKLESSGFELRKQPEPVGIPGITKELKATFTYRRGELDLRWKSVYGATGYQVYMTDKDPTLASNWEYVGYTKGVHRLFTGLASAKSYWFTVCAVGYAGQGGQCDPAMGIAA